MTWLLALVATLICAVCWEGFWRYEGFVPSLNNDPQLWITARMRASEGGEDAVVLVGSSRMQLGINPEALSAATGWRRPVQLAIAMGSSLPILQDLSKDPSFRGLVLCGIHPRIFFDSSLNWGNISGSYLRELRNSTASDRIEQRLRMMVQRSLVSRLPALSPRQLWGGVLRREWPRPHHIVITPDRFGYADFRRARKKASLAREGWQGRPYTKPDLGKLTVSLGLMIRPILERGGHVVFVRLPSSGEARQDEERLFPRADYWDVFAAGTTLPTIHFEDYPDLKHLVLPDGSHLDQQDAVAFSAALGRIIQAELESRGVR